MSKVPGLFVQPRAWCWDRGAAAGSCARGLDGAGDAEGARTTPSPPAPGWSRTGSGSLPRHGCSRLSLPPLPGHAVPLLHMGHPLCPRLRRGCSTQGLAAGCCPVWHLPPAPSISPLHLASAHRAGSCCRRPHPPALPGAGCGRSPPGLPPSPGLAPAADGLGLSSPELRCCSSSPVDGTQRLTERDPRGQRGRGSWQHGAAADRKGSWLESAEVRKGAGARRWEAF